MSGPAIQNRNPSPSVAVGPTDPIAFDVVQGSNPFLEIWIAVSMAGTSLYEVVWDGHAFAPLYAAQSRQVSITGGYRFTCRRTGGWQGSPTVLVKAIDTAGLEAS